MPEEKINCRIDYEAKDNPKCRIIVNGRSVHDFVADGNTETFCFKVANGPFDFRVLHHGKDMKREINKFVEIKKIYFNDIDFKNMLWHTVQEPDLPKWQNKDDYKWEANLYFGHNGYIEYKMHSPILDFLLEYHTKGAKVSSNMGSYNMELLNEMKQYFSKIVKEQDEKSQ
jgi:hypothetical protein